ncbi:MAG: TetR/AcrR family transcriptional regulator C-terminal domain-containing protein [Eggerthellaceae bacterium]|nr:TetR/AcrR family transcriptional regulator C-terminal domain-containing protein [Eggerthellaceae bacterium]MBQ6390188.1 TetR/AcrR family transcriptional regulator C-terminal domain-containing protein [Eggerthellaceae bacterium]
MNTKQMLFDAFSELVQEHDFDDITVQMILDRAHLSRGTFYRYFADKYDLMNSVYRDQAYSLFARLDKGDCVIDVFESYFHFIEQNKKYFARILKTEGVDSFSDFVNKLSRAGFSNKYRWGNGITDLDAEAHFVIEATGSGLAAVVFEYISMDCPLPPKDMARICFDIIPPVIRETL